MDNIYKNLSETLDFLYDNYPISCDKDGVLNSLYKIATGDAPLSDTFCVLRRILPVKYFDEGIDILSDMVRLLPPTEQNARRIYDFTEEWTIYSFTAEKLIDGDMLKYLEKSERDKVVFEKMPYAVKMRLLKEPYEMIKSGSKTVEVRLFDEKRKGINTGDFVIFFPAEKVGGWIIAKVLSLHKFNTFKELFLSDLAEKTGISAETAENKAEKMYEYYTREQEEKYGVLGIEIQPLYLQE